MLVTTALIALSLAAPSLTAAPNGTPWPMHVIDNTSEGADGVRLADINGDGLPDIATGWEEGNSIRAYLNPGPPHAKEAWPRVVVGTVGAPEDAVFADMDGDGAIDVVSCSEGKEQQVWIHWAPKDGADQLRAEAWETAAIPAASKRCRWMFSVPCDVNGDGRLDLIAGSKNEGAAIGWFEAPEVPRDLTAWIWHPMREAGWIMSLILHDMDGDGDEDLVYTDRRGSHRGMGWLERPGFQTSSLTLPWVDHPIGGGDREVMFLAQANKADGAHPAWVCTTRDGGLISAQQDEAGTWRSTEIAMPDVSGTGKGLAFGDLDGDGTEDLVISCENSEAKHGVFWIPSPYGTTSPARAISGLVGTKFDLVVLHDFDGDRDLDVLTCEEREGLGVIWYENPAH